MSTTPHRGGSARGRAQALLGVLRAGHRTVLVLAGVLVFLLLVFAWSLSYISPSASGERISIDQLRGLVAERRVEEATLRDQDSRLVGRAGPAAADTAVRPGVPTDAFSFWTSYPSSGAVTSSLIETLATSGARVEVDNQSSKQVVRTVATFLLPLMILADLFALLLAGSRSGGGIGGVRQFGTMSSGRSEGATSTGVTFRDVAGCDEAVAELAEIRDYLREPRRYERMGASPPKGVLLFGPPGCGKTLLARATAGEAGVPFFSVTGAEFVESLVGVGAARVRDLFARVRAVAPAIVFIDELDAAGRLRRAGGGVGGTDEREQTLNQLLVEIDGFSASSGIVVVAATNRPDIIDPALIRPGRFDRHVNVEPPDAAGRLAILTLHSRGKPLAAEASLELLAGRTPGFTGADLANVINEGALLAVRDRRTTIEQRDLEEAVSRVLHGPQRRGRVLLPGERERLAIHEAGHAVVAAALGDASRVHRVSILTGGKRRAGSPLGDDLDATVLTESRLKDRLSIALAGLAAEVLVLGETSTGAQDDIEEATNLARDFAGRYGLSPTIGRVRLLAPDTDVHLGDAPQPGWLSPAVHEQLDREVRLLLASAEASATEVLVRHRAALDALGVRVRDHETVEGEDLERLLALEASAVPAGRRSSGRAASRDGPSRRGR